jgi:predicted Zn-dependent peptidase
MSTQAQNIRKHVLPNGLVVITEAMPQVRSVAVGIWLRTGSRREPADRTGISHFIEHMVFKGTERRSAEEIAREIDSVGGMLDAFTAREMVCFNVKVLDEHLPAAFDVLADLVLRPRFADEEIPREKSVILEEIKMDEDNPDYLINEIFTQNFWPGHGLGKPILGTRETVMRFDRDALFDDFRRCYVPNNLVVTAAGNLEHARLADLVEKDFGTLPSAPLAFPDAPPEPATRITTRNKRELEQVHIIAGVPAVAMADERRYVAAILNTILGAGMSSRLFQNIRERQGLAYAVFSELSSYRDAGLLSVYAGTSLETANRVVELICAEFRDLKERAVPDEELRRAKEHLKGSLTLSLESTQARMSNLARQEIYFGRLFDLDEILAAIEAVSAEDVQRLARELFLPEKISAAVLGPLDGFSLDRALLAC